MVDVAEQTRLAVKDGARGSTEICLRSAIREREGASEEVVAVISGRRRMKTNGCHAHASDTLEEEIMSSGSCQGSRRQCLLHAGDLVSSIVILASTQ